MSAVPSTTHPGPSGSREAAPPGKLGKEGRGRGLPLGWGRGCGTPCIKRSESTIFHCRQSQPRHQLLGESSLKSLLILFLPLHFFSLSLLVSLTRPPFPLCCPFPNPLWRPGSLRRGWNGGGGSSCMHAHLRVHVCAFEAGRRVPVRLCVRRGSTVCIWKCASCGHISVCTLVCACLSVYAHKAPPR